jgi:phospholipase D1/2
VAQLKALSEVPSDVEKGVNSMKEKVKGALGSETRVEQASSEKEELRKWAAEQNQAQAHRLGVPSLHRQETLTDEKAGLQTLHEGQAMSGERTATASLEDLEHPHTNTTSETASAGDRPNSKSSTTATGSPPSSATAVEKDRTPNSTHDGSPPLPSGGHLVGFSESTSTATGTSTAHPAYSQSQSQSLSHTHPPSTSTNTTATATGTNTGSTKRRRRGTTRSSRRDFSAADDILSVEEAEDLLGCVQGHLVVWPYDWLEKVDNGGNWLFPLDMLTPIEIYI